MKKVYKYELTLDGYNLVPMPKGAKPLSVQVQRNNICMWCLVDPDEIEKEERLFRIAGTGHTIKDENLVFIDTFQLDNGDFIGHVFEVIRRNFK